MIQSRLRANCTDIRYLVGLSDDLPACMWRRSASELPRRFEGACIFCSLGHTLTCTNWHHFARLGDATCLSEICFILDLDWMGIIESGRIKGPARPIVESRLVGSYQKSADSGCGRNASCVLKQDTVSPNSQEFLDRLVYLLMTTWLFYEEETKAIER